VAFAYDSYTNPSKNNGVLRATLTVLKDLRRFLEAFPLDSDQWPAIRQAVKSTLGTDIRPSVLLDALKLYFRVD
jgi:hypothetical protein